MKLDTPNHVSKIIDTLPTSGGEERLKVGTGFVQKGDELSLQCGDLVVLAARPSMGVSALASQIALHAAIELNAPTLYFSMQHSARTHAMRLLSNLARFNFRSFRRNEIDDAVKERHRSAETVLRNSPIFIDDTPALTAKNICSRSEDFYYSECYGNDQSLGLIVIDNLQAMTPIYRSDAPDAAYSKTLSKLRIMARDLDVPVLLLSSLSRDVEKRKNKRPIQSDLPRPAIHAYADQILYLYREEYYDPETEHKGCADLFVHGSRDIGQSMNCWSLKFSGEFFRFENREEGKPN